MEFFKILLTSFLSVVVLFVITKIMGHKQVSQLDFFDYVCGITIGSIGAELATELEEPQRPLIALVVYGGVSLLLNLLTHKVIGMRKYVNGSPTILMNKDKLFRENFKKAKLDLSEFMLLCREQGYFDLGEIQSAVFEYNGKLSILPKATRRPLCPEDVNVPAREQGIGTEVILDGRIMWENLSRMGRDVKWLQKQIELQGYSNCGEVFLGVYNSQEGSVVLYPME